MVNMACDREEASFIKVVAVVLWYPPLSNNAIIWSALVTYSSVTLQMETDPSFYYLMVMSCYLFLHLRYSYLLFLLTESVSKSKICSL